MRPDFRKGFVLYKNGKGPILACPHSGPALEVTTSRDDNSETTGSLCWKKMGGTLIVSTVSRKRLWGVDFNRDIPPLKKALEFYDVFLQNQDLDTITSYKKRYGWVAKNEQDYSERLKIYQGFWGEIVDGENVILVHRQFNRLKSLPGLMDFIALTGRGVTKKKVKTIITDLNVKYYSFLKRVETGYKQAVFFETERMVAQAIKNYGLFDWKKFNASTRESFSRDLNIIQHYCKPYLFKRLQDHFTPQNYLECARSALGQIPTPPQVTFEHVFNGALAYGPRRKLFESKNRIAIEVEPSHFMNLWYPDVSADIIKDVIDALTTA